jgi:UDP-N-acetyl-D-glucosamine dehydrogenase
MSFIMSATEELAKYMHKGMVIVLESTTYPGTTDDVMREILETSGLKSDKDFALAYSPEREDPGNPKFETSTIPKIVGALSPEGGDMAEALYKAIVPRVVRVSDARTAEAVKLTENIFRAVNIALANELKVVFTEMEIDVWEVIDAADTKPFGFMAFYPGPGLGGHCIPIDPFYLTWKARAYGLHTRFIELAGEINNYMPTRVIEMTVRAMNDRLGKAMKGSRILVVGAAYKRNVDDMRESPSLTLIEKLQARGAHVDYYDPFIPMILKTREHAALAGMKSCDWDMATLASYDTAIVATDHDDVDYALLLEASPLVIDTRNALKSIEGPSRSKIVKA